MKKGKELKQEEELNREAKILEKEAKMLEYRKEELKRKEQIFDLQWKQLEYELSLFAMEKEAFMKEKRNQKYKERMEYEKNLIKNGSKNNAGMYFLGVNDELSLKKRYKDLLKMFHPDNMNGDVNAMQEINKEYKKLKKKYEEI